MFQLSTETTPVSVSPELSQLLVNLITPELQKLNIINLPSAVTLNFRDTDYSADSGGFHPVEIRIEIKDSKGFISYITDFCYVGQGWCQELTKSLDFDFSNNEFYALGFPYVPLAEAEEVYCLWQNNFLSYFEMGVFNLSVIIEN